MQCNKKGTLLTGISMVVAIMMIMNMSFGNPILGKWRSETVFPHMGKVTNTIEFKKESVSMDGITFKVNYEVKDKKVIVKDKTGIGTIYNIINDHTMKSNVLGIETVYKKIE
jgi:hypothetical protein